MNYGDSRNGDYKTWNTDQLDINTDVLVTYTRAFNKNLALTVNAGSSLYYRQIRNEYQATDGLIVPGVYNMGNSLNPVSATNSMNEKAIESIYGSVNLDLLDGIYLTLTGRNDWSSTLPVENRSYFYPSVGGGVVFTEFMPKNDIVTFGKVRASWARVGKDATPYVTNTSMWPGGT